MTISEVSEKYGLPVDTLRYYEKAGLIPPVNRKESGIRDYTEADCGWVEFIKCMRSAGLSIETLTEYIRLYGQGNRTLQKRKNLLVAERGPPGPAHSGNAKNAGPPGPQNSRLRR